MILSNLLVFERMRAELALFRAAENSGRPAPDTNHLIRQRVADIFYPRDDCVWKNLVTARGDVVLQKALSWLNDG